MKGNKHSEGRGWGRGQKEAFSKGVGCGLCGLFPGALSKIYELLKTKAALFVEKAICYSTINRYFKTRIIIFIERLPKIMVGWTLFCKEIQCYSLPLRQAAACMSWPKNDFSYPEKTFDEQD